MCTDSLGILIQRLEARLIVVRIGMHHSNDLLGINLEVNGTDAVVHLHNLERLAIGWHLGQIDVVHSSEFAGMDLIELDDDMLGMGSNGWCNAHRRRKDEMTFGRNLRSLDDGNIHLAEESVIDVLANHRKMAIEILDLASVDRFAHVRVRLERGTELDGFCQGQIGIHRRTCGTTCNETNLERTTCLVLLNRILGKGRRNSLRYSHRREAANTQDVVVFNKSRCLFGSHNRIINHNRIP